MNDFDNWVKEIKSKKAALMLCALSDGAILDKTNGCTSLYSKLAQIIHCKVFGKPITVSGSSEFEDLIVQWFIILMKSANFAHFSNFFIDLSHISDSSMFQEVASRLDQTMGQLWCMYDERIQEVAIELYPGFRFEALKELKPQMRFLAINMMLPEEYRFKMSPESESTQQSWNLTEEMLVHLIGNEQIEQSSDGKIKSKGIFNDNTSLHY